MKIKIRSPLFMALLLVALALVLVGCMGTSSEVTVDFYPAEEWQAILKFVTTTGAAYEMESQLNDWINQVRAQGVEVSWWQVDSEDSPTYIVEMQGTGLSMLAWAVFRGEAQIVADYSTGQRLIYFRQDISPRQMFDSPQLTLRGEEIVDGNGQLLDSQTMFWRNPSGTIWARLIEHSSLAQADAEMSVDFLRNETWRAVMKFSIPTNELGWAIETDHIESELAEKVGQARLHGIQASWRRDHETATLTYIIEMEGTGLGTLSWVVFDGEARIYAEQSGRQRLINLSHDWSAGWNHRSLRVTLKGGRVIDGNGRWIDRRTMTWQNPYGPVEVTLTEYTGLSQADANFTIDFYRSENWHAVVVLRIPAEALVWVEKETDIESDLNELVAKAALHGVNASWEGGLGLDDLTYIVEMEGSGLDTLSSVLFSGEAMIYAERSGWRRLVSFSQEGNAGWEFESLALTLRGGKIIEGNGLRVDNRTMTWRDSSGWKRVTLTERPRNLADVIVEVGPVVGAVVVLIVGIALLVRATHSWWRNRVLRPGICAQCGFQIPEDSHYCPECGYDLRSPICPDCGFLMPEDSVFCPACGREQGGLIKRLRRRLQRQAKRPPSETTPVEEPPSHPMPEEPLLLHDDVLERAAPPMTLTSTPPVGRPGLQGSLLEQVAGTSQRSIPLPPSGGLVLGSSLESDIRLSDPEVAAEHAIIRAARTCYFIEDLNSGRGTYVNDQPVRGAKRLGEGDVIRIGDTSFVFTQDVLP